MTTISKNKNREYLLTMLNALKGKRAAAAGLKVLVKKNLIDENAIMELLHIFLKVIYATQSKAELKKLQKSMKK